MTSATQLAVACVLIATAIGHAGCRELPATHDEPAGDRQSDLGDRADHDGDAFRTSQQAVARPGPWVIPGDVRAAGEAQYVAYDAAPLWDGGRNCGGSFLAGTRELADHLRDSWPGTAGYGGYSCRQNTADRSRTSVHGTGRAIDLFIRTQRSTGCSLHSQCPRARCVDGFCREADNDFGDPIANWLIRHAEEIGIQYIVWDSWQWSGSRSGRKDRSYGGPHPHSDHLHIELTHAAAARRTPWFGGSRCDDECPSGGRRCGGFGFQVCGNHDADACREWGGGGGCGDGCSGAGTCCSHECAAGSRRCAGSGYQVCGNHDGDPCREWGGGGACGGDCFGAGECCSHGCARGQRECTGADSYRTCGDIDADPCREWVPTAACADGGVCWGDGQCCSDACEEGTRRCVADGWQICADHDADPCLDWGGGAACGPGAVCRNDGECLGLSEDCANGVDDNADGNIDCDDPVCEPAFVCWSPESCDNGLDDDFDGLIDCLDDACSVSVHCAGREDCTNGVDDNGDGNVDCADPVCDGALDCDDLLEDCSNDIDDDFDGLIDCFDPDCEGALRCAEGVLDQGECIDDVDNDRDGAIDCDDPSCANSVFCLIPEFEDPPLGDAGTGAGGDAGNAGSDAAARSDGSGGAALDASADTGARSDETDAGPASSSTRARGCAFVSRGGSSAPFWAPTLAVLCLAALRRRRRAPAA